MSIPATMRALQQMSLEGPRDIRLIADAPVPRPDAGEVLIRVAAAGINFADISRAYGKFLGGPRPPYLAGFEAAGEVVAVGEAVTGPRPGAHVVGVGHGAFAEYMVLPAAAATPVPAGWSAEQALGLVVNWPTALAALRPLGRVAAGETVLIGAAAGATGQAAVAMAKHYGATVIATASPGKHGVVRALGADHVLDSRSGELAARVLELTGGHGADLVLESAGGAGFGDSLAAAKRVTGRVVVYGVAGGEAALTNWELVYRHQVQVIGLNLGVLNQAAPRLFGELLAHCYRMAGSARDAEDLVQETYLRAWRSYAGFEGRASLRSWLYAIATNVCLTALAPRRIRVLPSGLGGPYDGPDHPPSQVAPGEVAWLEPLPDRWIAPAADDPAAAAVARESLRLALIASLQHLPARQRAILILRDVLAFSAAETAEILGTTPAAVKSGLQRARARLAELEPEPEALLEPTDQRARTLLDAYIAAFERSDAALLEQVLRTDATLEATPFREWQAGRVNCLRLLAAYVLGAPGDWRMTATTANGQPAAAVYHRDAGGALRAHGFVVLAPTAAGVSRVVEFHDPALVVACGFPAQAP